jgi:hypothetical protein
MPRQRATPLLVTADGSSVAPAVPFRLGVGGHGHFGQSLAKHLLIFALVGRWRVTVKVVRNRRCVDRPAGSSGSVSYESYDSFDLNRGRHAVRCVPAQARSPSSC